MSSSLSSSSGLPSVQWSSFCHSVSVATRQCDSPAPSPRLHAASPQCAVHTHWQWPPHRTGAVRVRPSFLRHAHTHTHPYDEKELQPAALPQLFCAARARGPLPCSPAVPPASAFLPRRLLQRPRPAPGHGSLQFRSVRLSLFIITLKFGNIFRTKTAEAKVSCLSSRLYQPVSLGPCQPHRPCLCTQTCVDECVRLT